jgi:Voltage gated chloride channel
MTGVFTGLVGVILSKSVKTLIEFRNATMEDILERSENLTQAFIFNMAYGVTLVMVAACMVRCSHPSQPFFPAATQNLHCHPPALQVTFWAPTAAGAGVTLVMAYLNGTHIPNLLRFRTLITKVVGAAIAVPSGLAIGPEGPMVHIGACVASTITYANCAAITWLRYVWPWPCNGLEEGHDDVSVDSSDVPVKKGVWCQTWEELHEDSEHREFISAGAAAGLSVCTSSCTQP